MKHAVRYKDCLVLLAHKVIKRQTGFVRLKCRGGSRVGSRGGEGVARGLRGRKSNYIPSRGSKYFLSQFNQPSRLLIMKMSSNVYAWQSG